jgi:hypothetical protein
MDRCRVRSRAMAARYKKALEPPRRGPDLGRSERIYRTPETNVSMNCVPLRLVACRRRCRASYTPAPWTLMMGRSSQKATSDLRGWKDTKIYARGIIFQGHRKFRAICSTPSAS